MNENIQKAAKPGFLFYIGWIGLVAVVLLALGGLVAARSIWISRQTGELERKEQAGRLALVVPVEMSAASRTIELPGDVHGYFESPIYAKVPGYVKNVLVDKGAHVRAGQLLATLESPELDQQVATANAAYRNTAITDKRNQELVKARVIAQQAADDSRAAMREAYATWQSLVAQQHYERITAPFAGILTSRNVDPGALVSMATAQLSEMPIFTMATTNPVRVYVQMPQEYAAFINDGDAATVTIDQYPQREFKGSVTRHPSALSMQTRTMLVEVDLDNRDNLLLPGMYAHVAIVVSGTPHVPMVPDTALIFDGSRVLVPVVTDDHIILTPITLGYDDGIDVQVLRGLSGNEMVATNLGQDPIDGEHVHAIPQPRGQ